MISLVKSAAGALLNPTRQDLVAAVGELTAIYPSNFPISSLHKLMLMDPIGRRLLRERPLINSQTVDIAKLESLPRQSFGYAYYRFLHDNHVSPDTRAPIRYLPTDEDSCTRRTVQGEHAYIILRYRQIHDFIHILTGLPITVAGELGLKWFEFYQFGLPMQLLAGVFGPMRIAHSAQQRQEFENYWRWAIQSGPNSRFLLNVYFEEMFAADLEQVQQQLNLLSFPCWLSGGRRSSGRRASAAQIQFNSNTDC